MDNNKTYPGVPHDTAATWPCNYILHTVSTFELIHFGRQPQRCVWDINKDKLLTYLLTYLLIKLNQIIYYFVW